MTQEDVAQAPPGNRLPTGVTGMDVILRGGFLSGGAYLVQGAPGSGKTVLANQICAHHAARGGRALYVTLLSEAHDRLISHLRGMRFFDPATVPDAISYTSGFGTMEREGLGGILRMIRTESRARGASLVVLDGLFILEEKVDSEATFRRFVHDVTALAQLTDLTVLLLTNSKRGPGSPEYTMVDGWLELGSGLLEYRSYRYLQVHKFRGSDFIEGRHMLTISREGLTIWPRLESEHLQMVGVAPPRGRCPSGIPRFDELLQGGIPRRSSTLLVGPTGIGKTTFGLHFISQCSRAEPGLIFSFYENESDLREKADDIGLPLGRLIDEGAVRALRAPSIEQLLDELGYGLIEAVREHGVKRVFVEGVEGFRQSAVYPGRLGRFFTELSHRLRVMGVTALFTMEVPELIGGEASVNFGPVSAVAQNIVLLRYVELASETRRSLAIMKARESGFDPRIREFSITDTGIRIGGGFSKVEDVMTGHAHARRDADA